MREHLLLLTGRLAEARLRSTLEDFGKTDFTWEIRQIGVKVAGLLTTEIIANRLKDLGGATRILVPGRCRGDLDALGRHLGVPVLRGPDDLVDLPEYFGRARVPVLLDRRSVRIFAEIVDAPALSVAGIVARAADLAAEGADVIDIGCLPGTPFPHLGDAVAALKAAGRRVSVDSLNPEELRRGAAAGADFLLSLTEETLGLAFEVAAVPVLIPAHHGEIDGLIGAYERLRAAGRPAILDPVLDPINFGFADSLARYHALRRRLPDAEILMGIGNLTELTDADTTGMTAMLMGLAQELEIANVLVVQVSPHCRHAVREADWAGRIFHQAAAQKALPQRIAPALLALRDRRPFASTPAQIAEMAAQVRDPSYRVEVASDGIHVFNRAGHQIVQDPFDAYPALDFGGDCGHAFYLGVELARAQIAWQLGKRYVQDRELAWGCAYQPAADDSGRHRTPGPTFRPAAAGMEPEP